MRENRVMTGAWASEGVGLTVKVAVGVSDGVSVGVAVGVAVSVVVGKGPLSTAGVEHPITVTAVMATMVAQSQDRVMSASTSEYSTRSGVLPLKFDQEG
jgi:hypothetical protein